MKLLQHIISISRFKQPKYSQKSRKVLFVFWQCRLEKPTRPLTLNKDTVWYGLTVPLNKIAGRDFFSQLTKRRQSLLFKL
jgi:hypothetical protein